MANCYSGDLFVNDTSGSNTSDICTPMLPPAPALPTPLVSRDVPLAQAAQNSYTCAIPPANYADFCKPSWHVVR